MKNYTFLGSTTYNGFLKIACYQIPLLSIFQHYHTLSLSLISLIALDKFKCKIIILAFS